MDNKEKRRSVFVPNDLHSKLKEYQLELSKKGNDKTMAEIIEEGLQALRDAKEKSPEIKN